jgi:glycosyltransferase involved in cell wall biosynthesis
VRVLYLIDSLVAGGAEQSLAALAPEFVAHGIDLDVGYLYERDNVLRSAVEAGGARVHSLSGGGTYLRLAARARTLVRAQRPDIVHTTLFDADIVGRLAALGTRVQLVTTFANEMYGAEQLANPAIHRWKLRTAQFLDAATARRVNRFHAVSSTVADAMSRRLRIPMSRIDVIPRGRDPVALGENTAERRARARNRLCLKETDELVVAVGRHEYQKGFDVLVRAFASLRASRPRTQLVVAGRNGNESSQLEYAVRERHLENVIKFTGYRDDVPELLCAADVFVAPSRWEGSPGGVIEAMALATPIVASDIPAIREVLASDAGVLVPPEDANALAHALGRVLDAPSTAHTDAARARFVTRYTIDHVAEEMIAFYERVLRDRS